MNSYLYNDIDDFPMYDYDDFEDMVEDVEFEFFN